MLDTVAARLRRRAGRVAARRARRRRRGARLERSTVRGPAIIGAGRAPGRRLRRPIHGDRRGVRDRGGRGRALDPARRLRRSAGSAGASSPRCRAQRQIGRDEPSPAPTGSCWATTRRSGLSHEMTTTAPDEVRDRLLEAWRNEIIAGRRVRPDRPADAGAESGNPARWRRPRAATASDSRSGCGSSTSRSRRRTRSSSAMAPPAGADRAGRPPARRAGGGRGRGGRRLLQALDRRSDDRQAAARHPQGGALPLAGRPGHARLDRRSERGALEPISPATPLAVPGARTRLDRILGREKWHTTGGSWISGAIYGANDGLAAVFGIVAGVSGATGGSTASSPRVSPARSPPPCRWPPGHSWRSARRRGHGGQRRA